MQCDGNLTKYIKMFAYRNLLQRTFSYLRQYKGSAESVTQKRTFKRWLSPSLKEIERRKRKMGPQAINMRSNYLEWNHNAEIFAFGKRLHENFDESLLKRAFTHRSYILKQEMLQREAGIDNPEISLDDNYELVRKGEEFVSLYITGFLKTSLPKFPQSGLNNLHVYLLSDDILANVSSHLGTTDIILCGVNIPINEFPVDKATLAVTIKAVVGALIDSAGEARAGDFVKDFILTQLSDRDVNDFIDFTNSMEILADVLTQNNQAPPEPRLVSEAGTNTILSVFQVGIYSDKKLLAIGSGETIQVATDMAAVESLKMFFETPDHVAPLKFNTPQSKIIHSAKSISASQ